MFYLTRTAPNTETLNAALRAYPELESHAGQIPVKSRAGARLFTQSRQLYWQVPSLKLLTCVLQMKSPV
jgi:hypothetical protein